MPTDKLFTSQRLDSTGLYYYNARYYDATIGRFISADTIIQSLYCPQCFNRYSYCLNNPLKFIDPSGLTDVTAEGQPFTPEQIQAARLLGIDLTPLDLYYVTDANGTRTPVAADNSNQGPTGIPTAVYDVANQIREAEGDNDLTILWNVDDLILIDHYTYDETNYNTRTEQYYFNESRQRMELAYEYGEGKVDPLSGEAILRGIVGGLISATGLFVTYTGVVLYCDAWVPSMGGSLFWGPVLAWCGYEIFTFGYNFAADENYLWYNPFDILQ